MTRGRAFQVLKLLLAFAIAAAMPIAPVFAQSTPVECAAIAGNSERLACYDALFRGPGEAVESVIVQSERMIPALPAGRDYATFTVACAAEGIEVSFGFAGQFVSNTGDIAAVTFQVDQGGTVVRTLSADPTNKSLRFSSARDAGAFLDSLIAGRNLKVRMTPVRQRSVTVDFQLLEYADQIAALRSSCP